MTLFARASRDDDDCRKEAAWTELGRTASLRGGGGKAKAFSDTFRLVLGDGVEAEVRLTVWRGRRKVGCGVGSVGVAMKGGLEIAGVRLRGDRAEVVDRVREMGFGREKYFWAVRVGVEGLGEEKKRWGRASGWRVRVVRGMEEGEDGVVVWESEARPAFAGERVVFGDGCVPLDVLCGSGGMCLVEVFGGTGTVCAAVDVDLRKVLGEEDLGFFLKAEVSGDEGWEGTVSARVREGRDFVCRRGRRGPDVPLLVEVELAKKMTK